MPVRPGEKNAVIQPQITQISQIRENEVVETRGPSCLYLPQESRAAISHSSNLCNLRNLWMYSSFLLRANWSSVVGRISAAHGSLRLACWTEERRALRLHDAHDLAAALGAGFARPIVHAVVVLIASLFIQGVAVGAV